VSGSDSRARVARIAAAWTGTVALRARFDGDFSDRRSQSDVLGLRFFVCEGCETVYADVEKPLQCRGCGDEPVEELGPGTRASEYFMQT